MGAENLLLLGAKLGLVEFVKQGLQEGADVNCKIDVDEAKGITPLLSACMEGHLEIASLLLENGADPNAKIYFPKKAKADSALAIAIINGAVNGSVELARLLLYYGANPNDPSVVRSLGTEKVKIMDFLPLLLRWGFDPNTRASDSDGATVLHWAAMKGDLEAVKLLLERGADPTIPSRDGITPVMIAAVHVGDNPQILEILEEAVGKRSESTKMSAREGDIARCECGAIVQPGDKFCGQCGKRLV